MWFGHKTFERDFLSPPKGNMSNPSSKLGAGRSPASRRVDPPKTETPKTPKPASKKKTDNKSNRWAPVTTMPEATGQLAGWLTIAQLCWTHRDLKDSGITMSQVVGAIRSLKLYEDSGLTEAKVRGSVLRQRTTLVHPRHSPAIRKYLAAKVAIEEARK